MNLETPGFAPVVVKLAVTVWVPEMAPPSAGRLIQGVTVYVPAGDVLVMQFIPAALAGVWTVAATIKLTNTISAAIKIA
jgi:hypothetical protein